MNTKNLIFWGVITVIGILLVFNFTLMGLKEKMSGACVNDYSRYIKAGNCPCVSQEALSLNNNINFSVLTIDKNYTPLSVAN